jgi:hypothetical protein
MNHDAPKSFYFLWYPNGILDRKLKSPGRLGCFIADTIVWGLRYRKNIVWRILPPKACANQA